MPWRSIFIFCFLAEIFVFLYLSDYYFTDRTSQVVNVAKLIRKESITVEINISPVMFDFMRTHPIQVCSFVGLFVSLSISPY